MARGTTEGWTSGGGWSIARRIMWLALVACAGLWVYGAIRWAAEGEWGGAFTNALVVAACFVWLLTFGRSTSRPGSSWDPDVTVVRVGEQRLARLAVYAGVFPVIVSLGAFDGRRDEPSTGSTAFGVIFGLVMVGMIISSFRMSTIELTVGPDEVSVRMPRFLRPGLRERRRARNGIEGFRARFGSVELMPWPPPGGQRATSARSQQIPIPTQLLPRADVERAFALHGIGPV